MAVDVIIHTHTHTHTYSLHTHTHAHIHTQDDTDTEAILPHIATAIDFIDKAKAKGVATLVSFVYI